MHTSVSVHIDGWGCLKHAGLWWVEVVVDERPLDLHECLSRIHFVPLLNGALNVEKKWIRLNITGQSRSAVHCK